MLVAFFDIALCHYLGNHVTNDKFSTNDTKSTYNPIYKGLNVATLNSNNLKVSFSISTSPNYYMRKTYFFKMYSYIFLTNIHCSKYTSLSSHLLNTTNKC